MLVDSLSNVRSHFTKGRRYELGLSFLLRDDLAKLPPGRHEIAGDDAYALVLDYDTHPFDENGWEAHERYHDVQLLVSGDEKFTVAPVTSLMVRTPYDSAKDVALLSGKGRPVRLPHGRFVIFEPSDAHQPGISVDGGRKVRKVVVKIRV